MAHFFQFIYMRKAKISLRKEHLYRPSVRHNGHAHNGQAKKTATKKNYSKSYNAIKFHEGKQYTGAKVGRKQKWYYDKGEWKEQKVTPDKWEIHYAVTKRRAGKAPEGSGVPVGTEYDWYILAHQLVKKLNANDYSTEMTGIKYKVAHRRADKEKWNITDRGRHKRLIKLLKEFIAELEEQTPEPARKTAAKKAPVKKKAVKKKKIKEEDLVEA
jgi:hypothetical protein